MLSEKERLNQENFVDTSLLLDAVTSLIDAFKQAGYNPPITIQVDKKAFDKLLEETSNLYSSINVKSSIVNQEFSLANIVNIVLDKEETDNQNNQRGPQKQRDTQQELGSIEENQENQQLRLSATTTKYECTDCSATFDTTAGHRKHYQAFHGRIKEPKVIERAEI
jgi:hypothetical protein